MAKDKIISFFKKHQLESILLAVILFLSLFLRLYRIDQYMTFLGDEGRDVRIVRDIITKGNLVFIGPQTSVGNMYLGPLYYYMMAPALLLSGLNPVGPAIMIAFLSTVTVWLTWYVSRKWFGWQTALFASLFFAISPVAIIYGRSSWNPNPMPFFALLSVYFIYLVWKNHQIKWLPFIGFTFASALQMHYLGLLLAPVLGLFWLLELRYEQKQKIILKPFLIKSLLAIGVFIVMMSPLFFFDLKHNFMNTNAFKSFFTDRQTTVNLNPARSDRFLMITEQIFSDMIFAKQPWLMFWGTMGVLVGSIVLLIKSKFKTNLLPLYIWLGFAIVGLSVYKQHVYSHYFGFIFPAIFILLGAILSYLFSKNSLSKLLGLIIFVFLVFINLQNTPIKDTPNRQASRTEEIVNQIITDAKNEPFNFALIAKQNYDESYRYFLENKKANLVRGEDKVTNQLYVVCEDGDQCQPEGNSLWSVAVFGIAKIDKEWQVDGIRIYRLIHPSI